MNTLLPPYDDDEPPTVQPDAQPPMTRDGVTVEVGVTGKLLFVTTGSWNILLSRDEAIALHDLLPGAIEQMPVKL